MYTDILGISSQNKLNEGKFSVTNIRLYEFYIVQTWRDHRTVQMLFLNVLRRHVNGYDYG